jgi:uncharacterized repeat protein (TIGR03803 family)
MKSKLLLCLLLFPFSAFAQTYTYSTFARIPANSNKTLNATTGFLTIDGAGNLYGYSEVGLYGSIFKVTPKAAYSTVYNFDSTTAVDDYPEGGVIRDSSGNFYGEESSLHSLGGQFFKVTPTGQGSTLWASPQSNLPYHPFLFKDSAGNLYGYDTEGSSPNGISNALFKLSSTGAHTLLHTFCQQTNCTDGEFPAGGPIVNAKDGNIYGVAALGGQFNNGLLFRVTPAGLFTILYNFTGGTDSGTPQDKLVQDSSGNMYGTTLQSVFKITTSGAFTTLYSCTQGGSCSFGPAGPVIVDSSGNLFGTTQSGGTNGGGVVYEVSSNGTYTTLFNASSNQIGLNVVMDKAGNLYGLTKGEGTVNAKIFKLTKN